MLDAFAISHEESPLPKARISAVSYFLPEHIRTIGDIETKIKENSSTKDNLPFGLISRITGVQQVHVMPDDWQTSDLAVAAINAMREEHGQAVTDEIDLLIFASASQDMIEPATSHIVASKSGIKAPVMDVKNACNSMMNGIEVANAFIRSGAYRRVLVVSGECPSRGIRWNIPDKKTYMSSFPGFTMSDAGAAVLVESTHIPQMSRTIGTPQAEIIGAGFSADSDSWDVGMLPTGGSYYPRGYDRTYFEIDGGRLFEAFAVLGPKILDDTIAKLGFCWDDFAMIGIHQVALPYLDTVREKLGIPTDKTVITLDKRGNIASCSLPLQLKTAMDSGMVKPGDTVALVGLAGGISIGVMIVRM